MSSYKVIYNIKQAQNNEFNEQSTKKICFHLQKLINAAFVRWK